MAMKPMERVSATDYVVNNLIDYISSGKVRTGDKLLSEKEICNLLSVSRSTVREALRVLQAMGYVNIILGRGAFVTKVTVQPSENIHWIEENRENLDDVMLVRYRLEILAVELAADRATEDDLKALDIAHQSFVDAYRKKDAPRMTTSDELFHNLIFSASHNKPLVALYKEIKSFILPFRGKSFTIEQIRSNAMEPHTRILEALKTHNKPAAIQAMSDHMNITLKDLHSFGFASDK